MHFGHLPTRTIDPSALVALKHLTLKLLPTLRWRRHGIGVLQGYVTEGDEEFRIHIWHPKLMLPGIEVSGNAHNHRFSFDSTVLVGEIRNVFWQLQRCENGDHVLYDFVHARKHTPENRTEMRLLTANGAPELYSVAKTTAYAFAGETYRFLRGDYHNTDSDCDGVTITLVHKFDQVPERARVCAPKDIPPVPAFSAPPMTASEIEEYLGLAEMALEKSLREPVKVRSGDDTWPT